MEHALLSTEVRTSCVSETIGCLYFLSCSLLLRFHIHSFFCDGVYRHLSSFDFVGTMNEGFYSDLEKMGKQLGITRELQSVFSYKNRTSTKNQGVETAASSHVLEYYTPRTVKRVLEYLSMDYVMLNMPIPDWAVQLLESEEDVEVSTADS